MKVLREDDQKTAVVGWGRFNPPTIGHNELVNTLADIASKNNADPLLYMSHKYQDKKEKDSRSYFKDPLKYEDKLYFAKKAFGDRVNVLESDAKTIIQVFQDLQARGYKNIIYVGGSDRIGGAGDITKTIEKYNGNPDTKGNILYDFDSISFVKAGKDRDEDSDDVVTSASASLARKYAIDGDFESFKEIVPLSDIDAEEMYNLVRAELGVTENLNEANMQRADVLKDYNNYYERVINDLSGNGVKLKDGDIITVNDEDSINDLKDKLSNQDADSRMKAFYMATGHKWNEIDKSVYSGKGGAMGQSAGEHAEPAVCYIYNHPDDYIDVVSNYLKGDPIYVESSIKLANQINDIWSSKNYVAIHVNSNDLEDLPYQKYAGLFKSKIVAAKIIGLQNDALKDLYFRSKDNWDKADMLLIKKDLDIDPARLFNDVTNSEQYNERLHELDKSQLVIPISLKSKSIFHGIVNPINDPGEIIVRIGNIRKEDFNTNNANIVLISSNHPDDLIQFRAQTQLSNNTSIEVIHQGSRGGKGITKVKAALGDYYQDNKYTSNEDILNIISDSMQCKYIGKLPTNVDSQHPWYNRPGIRGLANVWIGYKNATDSNSIQNSDIQPALSMQAKFYKWLYDICTTGEGSVVGSGPCHEIR